MGDEGGKIHIARKTNELCMILWLENATVTTS
jgi:hypothetical protein